MKRQPLKDKAISTLFFIKEKSHIYLPLVKSGVSKNIILLLAVLAAIISCFFVPPNKAYLGYINYKTICTLLSLLLITMAMRSVNMFQFIAMKILSKVKTIRSLSFIMVLLPTVFAFFITNDIAVLTFVPFSIVMLKIANQNEVAPKIITFQIIGANLSGLVSPLGNAQNLLIFETHNVDALWFLTTMYPIAIIGYIALFGLLFTIKNKKIEPINEAKTKIPVYKYIIYSIMFLICVLSVLKIINIFYTTIAVLTVILIFDPIVFRKTNYSIILLFIAFFIFVGNISNIPIVNEIIEKAVRGNEYFISVGLSQILSNTPATLLVFNFSENITALVAGVNVGKFGTFISSMSYYMAYNLFSSSTKNQLLIKKLLHNLLFFNMLFLAITFLAGLIII